MALSNSCVAKTSGGENELTGETLRWNGVRELFLANNHQVFRPFFLARA